MLCERKQTAAMEWAMSIYETVVPADHFLRKVAEVLPWDEFAGLLEPFYCRDKGRPAEPPVMMLKLEYLRYHHNLSDREVVARARTDLAFRWFLGLPLSGGLPDPSSLCVFRGRLGTEGFRRVFDQVVGVAREHGIVKDRLRIKDATHVIANIAVPTALALVAQARDKLLVAAEPFAPLMVEGERVNLESLRERTSRLSPSERLATRVAHLKEVLSWADQMPVPENSQGDRRWQTFLTQREIAHKILADEERPGGGDRTLSTVDPEARRAKHGQWFVGYKADILMDADSELITQVNVLPAGGDEGRDAVELIRQEEAAHGNDVRALSMDGAGFHGPALRQLQDPQGLHVDTYVPVPQPSESESTRLTPQDFHEDAERGVVTCPAGQTSTSRHYERAKETTKYTFSAATCAACPLMPRCMEHPPKRKGRTVCKSDYSEEHQRAREKTQTPEYAAIRREHLAVERKLGEVMNRHGGRRARYRSRAKVLKQQLMASMATNIKRMVRLLCVPIGEIAVQT